MKQKICYILFVLLVLLNIYDTYSTNTLLSSGKGFYEVNPIMRLLMNAFGQLTGMIAFKAIALGWFLSFLFRAKTERMENILMVGLLICVGWYGAGMYFLNYKSMLLLGGMS